MKKEVAPIICQEELEEPEIPDAVPIYGLLRVNALLVHVREEIYQAPINGGVAPSTVIPNPYQVHQPHVPPNNQEVAET